MNVARHRDRGKSKRWSPDNAVSAGDAVNAGNGYQFPALTALSGDMAGDVGDIRNLQARQAPRYAAPTERKAARRQFGIWIPVNV
jgi:hypothetical protein